MKLKIQLNLQKYNHQIPTEKDSLKKLDKGLEKLYKSVGGTILLSFPYKNELYFITSNSKEGTFLAKRKDSELVKVKKLLDYRVYTYETEIKVTDDNHYLNNFRTGYEKKIGFFNVNDNIVSINIYE